LDGLITGIIGKVKKVQLVIDLIDVYLTQEEDISRGQIARVMFYVLNNYLKEFKKIDGKKLTLKLKNLLSTNPDNNVFIAILIELEKAGLVDQNDLQMKNFDFKFQKEWNC
jgi:hypothetical protein